MALTKVQKEGIETLINNNADNRVITGSGTANTLNGESNVVIDSSGRLLLGTTTEGQASADDLTIATTGNTGITVRSGTSNTGNIYFSDATSGAAEYAGYLSYSHSTNSLSFGTNDGTERMRIDSSGRVGIGATSFNDSAEYLLVKNDGTAANISIVASNDAHSSLNLGDEDDFNIQKIRSDHTNNSLQLFTNNAERMRIDSSGRLGIGTTSPVSILHLHEAGASGSPVIQFSNGDTGATSGDGFAIGVADDESPFIYNRENTALRFATNNTERMRIDSSGNVGIGTSSPSYLLNVVKGGTNVCRFQQTTNNQGHDHACINIRHAAAVSGQDGVGMLFQNSGGTTVGRIDIGQSTTGYVTSSDYRLKENATAISDGITRLKTLKPYQFNWIAEKGQPKVDGFFAHEVTSAVPEAITGTKDEVDTDNNPVYQAIDQSKLVPLLTAALQEAIAKIEVLETKVAALEAA